MTILKKYSTWLNETRKLGIASADDNRPYKYSSKDFKNGSQIATKKGSIGVKWRVGKPGEKIKTKEGESTVPKGHVVVSRPGVDSSDNYHMPAKKFKELHHKIVGDAAEQRPVQKPVIKAHRDGVFHPPWAKEPMKVNKGDYVVNNDHHNTEDHNDVASIKPDVFHKTYTKEDQ